MDGDVVSFLVGDVTSTDVTLDGEFDFFLGGLDSNGLGDEREVLTNLSKFGGRHGDDGSVGGLWNIELLSIQVQ